MEDKQIVDLYWQRSENAITETDAKYGPLCFRISYNVLASREDAEESVSDTYFAAWKRLPPQRPEALAPFLGKIARNISISRWRSRTAQKRGGGEIALALEELGECVSGECDVEKRCMDRQTVEAFNRYLDKLPEEERNIFLRRYWCMDSVGDIARDLGCTQSRITSILFRTRKKLRGMLEKEGLL